MIICVGIQTILKSGTGAYFVIISHIVTVKLVLKSASTGWEGLLWSSLSAYSRCMVPRCPRTATVWSRPCTLQRLYRVHWWLSLSIGANQQRKMFSKVARRIVAERWTPGTVHQLYTDTDDHKRPTRPVVANPIVVKMMWTVLCSSCDGVPLKWKKENGRTGSLKLSVDWYHFRPLLAVVGQYL